MNNKHRNITLNQFDLMKHALGIDEYTKPKRGTYKAYRNYFCTCGKDAEWESLVECGVATSRIRDPSVFYHVSKDGLLLMEEVLGFKIVEGN